ncbi:hypothetical protein CEUSTIGMA_g392.t1 [Chlamydomonas eustigma]|uniref:DUF676 domain-containing protein n=1 Tax=Chlamydomonas eustigma TaxID=1157962 RepID=A0A250WQ21_9CHLO|nr:hypothetical protein CEUSTIGMA_g392.t1 [Chlamydomonas eustigma]|eukprot:GAX72937.1 hypothetical protein CEUSTIGMA_g392.t1 [Chlamydomonas eustigma]
MRSAKENVHLVVLQHGLWGIAENLSFLESELLRVVASTKPSMSVKTLNSNASEKKKTYDGIDVCGERLITLIKERIETLASEESCIVTHLSFIGYSMGGLITRYVVGKLEWEGSFSKDGFTPVNFITIATPHLGSWRPSKGFRDTMFNGLVTSISSWSGYHVS